MSAHSDVIARSEVSDGTGPVQSEVRLMKDIRRRYVKPEYFMEGKNTTQDIQM